jgi:protein SCO1/2
MFVIIIVILIAFILIAHLKKENDRKVLNIGGNFSLIDQNGDIYESKIIQKKKLIYFGYTFCPDICPFDILKLSNFLDKNPSVVKTMDFIFITVDPERDDVVQMNNFLKNFNQSIKGLTGKDDDVANVLRRFRIYSRKNKTSSNDKNYLVDHSSLFFLIDKKDKYLTHFRPNEFKSKISSYLD